MMSDELTTMRAWILKRHPDLECVVDLQDSLLIRRAMGRWNGGCDLGQCIMFVHKDMAAIMGEQWDGGEYILRVQPAAAQETNDV